ncbi:MAG: PASTA domain-containing protein [Bacteroidaceae bacterium]|nr:PASTA domain-containing protein [Bacteroidaceae bacterium]
MKRLFSPIVWGNLLAMAVVVVLLFIGVWKGLQLYTHHGEGVPVPSVIGMMESDARYALGRVGLVAVVVDSAYNKTLPAGSILEQTPGEGSNVKAGREIYLTVNSEDTPTLPLPDIAENSSLRQAEAKLRAMGFKLGPVEYVPGDKDWVYGVKSRGRNVYAGERVPLDVPLVLQVGNSSDDLSGIVEEEEDWTNEADATVPPEEPTGLESFE